MTKQATSTTEVVKQFNAFWDKSGRTASTMMAEFNRVITLVPGREDRQVRAIARGSHVAREAIILSKWGLQKASLIDGKFGSGQPISPEEAIEAFSRAFPDRSFMDVVTEGYNALFR